MMRNLLSEEFIFTWLLKFEGLSQKWIEWFLRKFFTISVLNRKVNPNVGHSLDWVFLFCSKIKNREMFCRGSHFLQKTLWLIEIDRDGYL